MMRQPLLSLLACLVTAGIALAEPPDGPPPEQTVALAAKSACTKRACIAGSCCNKCVFRGWEDVSLGSAAVAAPGTAPLPSCPVNGCGRCPFKLEATGHRRGSQFIVSSWTKHR